MRLAAAILLLALPCTAAAQLVGEKSETPAQLKPVEASFDYQRRDVMIPMRDGVRLHTVILIPRGAHEAPLLLTRTPYDATELTTYNHSGHLIGAMDGYDNVDDIITASGYIRVVQDIRGKYGSEGDYYMNRPPIGPLNTTKTDESTDTYDTIDWLVKNVPDNNGRVGTIGISYDGWTALISLMNPHPALKAAVPMNPMVDGWIGDDWFHNGAFRQLGLNYIYEQEATRANDAKWWDDHYDDYDAFLELGSAGAIADSRGMNQVGFYRKLTQHPNYDAFWQEQAMDKLLAKQKLTVPTMLVHSLWDQEDIYGAPAVWKALKPLDGDNKLYLAMGPWHHGQELGAGSHLSDVQFGADTGFYFRWQILKPFLDMHLKGGPIANLATVNAFESGTNRWLRLQAWPQGCETKCTLAAKSFFMQKSGALSDATTPDGAALASYISDPAKPVPFIQRPVHLLADDEAPSWRNWLATDQREASTRPDVLTFKTEKLTASVKIAGQPQADLNIATTGTDGDFVVKVIDVYPDEVAQTPVMGGYQLMVSADILRGRFRNAPDQPTPIPANQPQHIKFALPTANHVFLPGHRIMVQIQSSWFPLYDRNPQTFVPNIFFAKPDDYKAATITLLGGSHVTLPMVSPAG